MNGFAARKPEKVKLPVSRGYEGMVSKQMIEDLKRSVIAVPPLARNADLSVNRDANAALIRYLEDGGIRTLMYGGNANFQNIGLYEYAAILEMLLEIASQRTWLIPSAGPDFGKMMDQAEVLRRLPFSTAMVLPATSAFSQAGVEDGIRRFAERLGRPAIAYVRSEAYLAPAQLQRLVDSGTVRFIKYAIVRKHTREDAYLADLVARVDRNRIVSGFGERPAIDHMRTFGLAGFTSGCVCIAPRISQAILEAIRHGEFDTAEELRARFLPLEDCRDAYDPVRVLHEAVSLAGIANTGPLLPLQYNLESAHHQRVGEAARVLRALNDAAVPA